MPEKLIIDKGSHDLYQIDLWYLPIDLKEVANYNYINDIFEHFSKWICPYPIVKKTTFEVLLCLKKYINSFGFHKKLQSANGTEFKNIYIFFKF